MDKGFFSENNNFLYWRLCARTNWYKRGYKVVKILHIPKNESGCLDKKKNLEYMKLARCENKSNIESNYKYNIIHDRFTTKNNK